MRRTTGMNRKKVFILICVLLFSAVLAGFEKRTVELQNNPKTPLIDLDKAIDRASWGTDGDAGGAADAPPSGTVSEDGVSGNAASGLARIKKEFAVKIRGKVIRLDGIELKDADDLKKKLAAEYKDGDTVKLSDDYADADTYREAVEALRELAETKGLVYSDDYGER